MEEELSRSSTGEDDDFDDTADDGEDFEATIDEEELLEEGEDYVDELRELEDEGEMPIEELRRRYGIPEIAQKESRLGSSAMCTSSPEQLSSTSSYFNCAPSAHDDDEDADYAPPDPWKREIRIDAVAFQAQIPSLLTNEEKEKDLFTDRNDSMLLWAQNGSLSDADLDGYLRDVIDLRIAHDQPITEKAKNNCDDEDALCALLRNGYDLEKAKASYPFAHVNTAIRSVRCDALAWDIEEKMNFELALEKYGKDFSLIRKVELPYRQVGELVEHYYNWKTTESYRIWRKAHPQHVPVVQPHVNALRSFETEYGTRSLSDSTVSISGASASKCGTSVTENGKAANVGSSTSFK